MKKNIECTSCGYKIKSSNDKFCPYCGNSINRDPVDDFSSAAKKIGRNLGRELEKVKKSEFNVALFVVLLIVCWPVAIVYLVVTSNEKNKAQ